ELDLSVAGHHSLAQKQPVGSVETDGELSRPLSTRRISDHLEGSYWTRWVGQDQGRVGLAESPVLPSHLSTPPAHLVEIRIFRDRGQMPSAVQDPRSIQRGPFVRRLRSEIRRLVRVGRVRLLRGRHLNGLILRRVRVVDSDARVDPADRRLHLAQELLGDRVHSYHLTGSGAPQLPRLRSRSSRSILR